MALGPELHIFQAVNLLLPIGGMCGLILLNGEQRLGWVHWQWYKFMGGLKYLILGLLLLATAGTLEVVFSLHYRGIGACNGNYFNYLGFLGLQVSELSLIFMGLVVLLYPLIIIIMDLECTVRAYKYLVYMLWLFITIYFFMFTDDLLVFYILYELMISLVFFVMYLTANSRGGVEAILFFMGWAIVGSICISGGVIYLLSVVQLRSLSEIALFNFTPNEVYYLSLLFFFGFGTKLSIWPFWYWLPRAHVEVSTGMSIFLSCILIKVCFYGLVRVFWVLGGGEIIIPLVFFVCVSAFDVTLRLASQVDLKAITAYGSVLHVNLLALLFLLDSNYLSSGLIYYIWGHSFATAGIFYVISLIERCYGSRSTFELSGIYTANPLTGILTLGAVIAFLEFPLNFFFWGEMWLWAAVIDNMPVTGLLLMFVCVVMYMIIFFRLWWGLIFGSMSNLAAYPRASLNWEELIIASYLIGIQFLIGFQPGVLNWLGIC